MAALAALTACTNDADTPDPPATSTPDTSAVVTQCPDGLADALAAWGEAGFSGSITVSTAGEFDCRAAYGLADRATATPNTPDTVFSIGSVTKAFTAAAVADLVDSGQLDLGDRAGDVVDGLDGAVASVTVEQLLRHTSGLTGSHGQDHEPLDRAAAVAAIAELELAFEPGTDHLYSNAGYTLLALIVEEVSGSGFREYLASRVLPLPDGDVAGGFWDGEPAAPGPRAVGYLDGGPTEATGDFAGPHWALRGNGGLAMTTPELAVWTHALFTGQVVARGAAGDAGWVSHDASRYGEPFLTAAGGGGDIGHDVVALWVPRTEQVITVASNTPAITAEELLQAVGPALVTGEPVPAPDTSAVAADPEELAAAAGRYELPTAGSYTVAVRDAGLAITAHGPDAVAALFPPPRGVTSDDAAAHEDAVLSLLAGETQEGRDERALLASDIGAIRNVDLAGTITSEGELRTYVVVTAAEETIMLWYALDEHGGIAGAEGPTDPPTLLVRPSNDGAFRPDDPAGGGAATTVRFEDGDMTVSGPTGRTTARSAP
ncbi:CubicO group peptidase (beta-lactamase class C family) [Haloactinopolyspora alba]|uniref:CubicO group peptidase (Beta-lactamase class C family) n=2 Tax=Haloactinopolyspora alba TaxID=648780 RepID=A0A2P8E533_9ACTN|nr:CubicO group peptidase (beta-lactamase class C family) [Haloactinopolyspora alba]